MLDPTLLLSSANYTYVRERCCLPPFFPSHPQSQQPWSCPGHPTGLAPMAFFAPDVMFDDPGMSKVDRERAALLVFCLLPPSSHPGIAFRHSEQERKDFRTNSRKTVLRV